MPRISQVISRFTSKEVSEVFKKAKRVKVPSNFTGFDILCARSDKDFGRILIITPGRIGKAYKRNLIKRRLKAIFYEQELYKYCIDLIIIVKKEGLDRSFDQLKTLLLIVMERQSDKETKTKFLF